MKNLIVSLLVVSMMLISSLTFADSYDSDTGILMIVDETYQTYMQLEYCTALMGDRGNDAIKHCYTKSKESYKLFMVYMTSDSNDPLMNACLGEILDALWIEEDNSTWWYAFMKEVGKCYVENNGNIM